MEWFFYMIVADEGNVSFYARETLIYAERREWKGEKTRE